jgi:uncharacterized membrane protein
MNINGLIYISSSLFLTKFFDLKYTQTTNGGKENLIALCLIMRYMPEYKATHYLTNDESSKKFFLTKLNMLFISYGSKQNYSIKR